MDTFSNDMDDDFPDDKYELISKIKNIYVDFPLLNWWVDLIMLDVPQLKDMLCELRKKRGIDTQTVEELVKVFTFDIQPN